MTNKFIHFRVQSSYSMLESTIKIPQLVELTKNNWMGAVCLADRGNLFASLEFALEASKAGVQPIHGAILNILFSNKGKDDFAEIVLIAKNDAGYKNLLKLASYTFTKNDRKTCNHITFDDLEKHNEGLIVLSAYTAGIIGKFLLQNNLPSAKNTAKKLQQLFGDRFYFEIMRHGSEKEKRIEDEYLQIANEFGIPLLATNQVLFSDVSMHDAHDVLLCISEGVVQEVQDRKRVSNNCYFKSTAEMIALFKDLPEAIENTVYLAQRCSIMAETRPPSLPKFSNGEISEEVLIRDQAKAGLEEKLAQKIDKEHIKKADQAPLRKAYFERLEYELGIICRMDFSGYFLIVSDFIRWSKENGIAVGPGRGSGAGSIVAWVLKITDLDPIEFGLLFERFLNPERVSMPDFDIDFCQERREEVISYVRSKYGNERVGQIITFGKLQAKAAIKDVARVLGLNYSTADYLTELVPFNAVNPVTLSQAIADVAELKGAARGKGLYNLEGDNELIKQVLSTALTLEGLQRHSSTHAAGVVIANQDMTQIVPVYKDVNADMLISQYSMKYCELAGLVKFDFLGLQTLTVITKTIKLLEDSGVVLDIEKIPFDDKKTFKMLANGLSTGVFQFESIGMKSSLRRLKPDNINDIIALGALYRPGPMDNIPTYIACKHGEQEVDYLHPLLESTLKDTYGVIIYQEQVMEIARKLAGYSAGTADLLRRAMGKKVKAEMDAQEEIFVKGALANKVSESDAKSIFATVAKFAGYGFNKAHAAAYGVISYQTAYLKANFPVEFLIAALNLDIDSSDKISIFLQEAKNANINVIAPDINESSGLFEIKNDNDNAKKSITFALGAIKSVTVNFGNAASAVRMEKGNFKSIIDFAERIDPKLLNKRLLESTIKAGCFDKLHPNRNSLLQSVPKIMAYSAAYHLEQKSHQISLISVGSNGNDVLVDAEPLSASEIAYAEFDVMGLFLKNHPLSGLASSLKKCSIKDTDYIKNELPQGSHKLKLAGIIVKKDARMSKRGLFVTLIISDPKGIFEVTIYNEDVFKNYAHLINVKEPVIIYCDILKDKGGLRTTALRFSSINDELQGIQYNLTLSPKKPQDVEKIMELLNSRISQDKSNSSISVLLPVEEEFVAKITMPPCFRLNEEDAMKLSEF
ncbi:MAG: DNA polymerase III subunit alpha [Rickettsiales bacterium]|nr:MAG: DNA polymerase III subunit alpha [Rickettsiales bacterium]